MRTVLLIGMGQFGQLLGENLLNMGNEVMIVDKEEDIINSLSTKYTGAIICNCMVEDNLKALDVPSYDVCVVTIADDFQSSLEITSILKDLGAKYIIAKANKYYLICVRENLFLQKRIPISSGNFCCV